MIARNSKMSRILKCGRITVIRSLLLTSWGRPPRLALEWTHCSSFSCRSEFPLPHLLFRLFLPPWNKSFSQKFCAFLFLFRWCLWIFRFLLQYFQSISYYFPFWFRIPLWSLSAGWPFYGTANSRESHFFRVAPLISFRCLQSKSWFFIQIFIKQLKFYLDAPFAHSKFCFKCLPSRILEASFLYSL